jgi:hypothetical protein
MRPSISALYGSLLRGAYMREYRLWEKDRNAFFPGIASRDGNTLTTNAKGGQSFTDLVRPFSETPPEMSRREREPVTTPRMSHLLYQLYEHWLRRQIRAGPMPEHVGLILDGNRRYARTQGFADPGRA